MLRVNRKKELKNLIVLVSSGRISQSYMPWNDIKLGKSLLMSFMNFYANRLNTRVQVCLVLVFHGI